MPVLRMPTDTTLGDTLGNLGRSLTEGFNPLNQLRAYDIQQQMWMRQQQLLQLQRENAARQAAIQQWGSVVPPDKLPQISLMIYQNAPYDQIARAAAQLSGNLIDDPAAEQKNIDYITKLTGKPYDYATMGPPVAGPNTAKAYDDWKVSQAGKTAASTALGTATGEQASRAPLAGMIDEDTPAAALHNQQIYQTVYGKPPENGLVDAGPITAAANKARMAVQQGLIEQAKATGGQQARQALVSLYKDDPTADAANRAVYSVLNNGAQFEAGMPVPVGPNTNAAYNKALGNRQETQAEAEARGKILGGGVTAPTTIPNPSQLPPTTNPNLQPTATPAPAPAPTPAPAPAPVPAPVSTSAPAPASSNTVTSVSVPNPSAPFAPPTPVTRQTPAGTIIGQTAPEAEAATATTKARSDQLQQAMDEGATASRLKVKLGQLRDLSTIAQTGGAVGQFNADIAMRLAKAGYVVGDRASALKAMDQILNTEIPDLRKQAGIQRLAGPEIVAVGKQIGSANLPPDVLNNIIANEEAAADTQIQRRVNAQRTLGLGDQPMSYTDFVNADNDLNNQLRAHTDALRQQYGAIGTQAQAPPTQVVAPPPSTASVGNPLSAIIQWITGGGSQAAPATAPAPSVEIKPNPDGTYPDAPRAQ